MLMLLAVLIELVMLLSLIIGSRYSVKIMVECTPLLSLIFLSVSSLAQLALM